MSERDYNFKACWSEEDREWVGRCDAFPSLSWLAPSRDAALAGIRALVEDGAQILRDRRRPLADPSVPRTGSRPQEEMPSGQH